MATQNDGKEYVQGQMDISEHQKTFDGFVRISTWVVIACIVVLIFMALANG